MRVLCDELDLGEFFETLGRARERVLMLDYDGTLAPFHVDPRLALPHPNVCAVLRRIAATRRTRIVIVSGRRLEDLRAPLAMLPHDEVWASHGWERRGGAGPGSGAPAASAREALGRARSSVQPLVASGVRLESKIASLALHWRGLRAPDAARIRSAATEAWEPFAGQDLELLPFDGGLEIRARGRDKGDAVRAVLGASPGSPCAYLGDDLTDEDAFRAIRPHGLGVLVRETPRATVAQLWLSRRYEITSFLQQWCRA